MTRHCTKYTGFGFGKTIARMSFVAALGLALGCFDSNDSHSPYDSQNAVVDASLIDSITADDVTPDHALSDTALSNAFDSALPFDGTPADAGNRSTVSDNPYSG